MNDEILEMMAQVRATIQEFRRKSRDVLLSAASSAAPRERYNDFIVSEGWEKKSLGETGFSPSHFTEKRAASTMKLSPTASGSSAVCVKHDLDFTYNVDATGLFFRTLPEVSYLAPGEHMRTTRGVKGMEAKDRVTAYLCTDATGRRVPLSLIGAAKEPRCFQNPNITGGVFWREECVARLERSLSCDGSRCACHTYAPSRARKFFSSWTTVAATQTSLVSGSRCQLLGCHSTVRKRTNPWMPGS